MRLPRAHLERVGRAYDALIAQALQKELRSRRWTDYELEASLTDLLQLSNGSDACYDRPSSGWAYAAWYHGRRIHGAIRALAPVLVGREEPVTVVDLGTGTGAVLWALVALRDVQPVLGETLPPIRVAAIDASEPMLATADVLWQELAHHDNFAPAARQLRPEFLLASWTDLAELQLPQTNARMLVGSYLFDDSDRDRAVAIGSLFAASADAVDASEILLIGSARKADVANSAGDQLRSAGWAQLPAVPTERVLVGKLERVQRVRADAYRRLPVLERYPDPPTWHRPEDNAPVLYYSRTPTEELFPTRGYRGCALDAEQDAAANPEPRLTAILGAAGSGKSCVVVERAVRTVDQPPRATPHVEMLVTTFNKALVDQLAAWMEIRIRKSGVRRWIHENDRGRHRFFDPADPGGSSITLMTWDKIGSRVYEIQGESKDRRNLGTWDIAARLAELNLRWEDLTEGRRRVLHPSFIEAEHRRIIYGRRVWHDRDAYLAEPRHGRLSRIGPQQRELVWDVVTQRRTATWTGWRIQTLEAARARSKRAKPPFTHLIIDECQDLTPADYELATLLVPDPNNIVVAGDEAQSLHLGSSYERPGQLDIPEPYRTPDKPLHRRWKVHRLSGSYRLPLRICESVQPIAARISETRQGRLGELDVELPDPRKPAVLGIRPIVVTAKSEHHSLARIFACYQELLDQAPNRIITFAEERGDPSDAEGPPSPPNYQIEYRSMRTIKGLERPCIVWRTAVEIPAHESELEWIYTILTRTTALAIISVDPEHTPEPSRVALRLLRHDRLLVWDADADQALRQTLEASIEQDDWLRFDEPTTLSSEAIVRMDPTRREVLAHTRAHIRNGRPMKRSMFVCSTTEVSILSRSPSSSPGSPAP